MLRRDGVSILYARISTCKIRGKMNCIAKKLGMQSEATLKSNYYLEGATACEDAQKLYMHMFIAVWFISGAN